MIGEEEEVIIAFRKLTKKDHPTQCGDEGDKTPNDHTLGNANETDGL